MLSVDFDGPIRLCDRALPFTVEAGLAAEGRFGTGYACIRDTKNLLPYADASLETNVTDGVYVRTGIKVMPETRWRTWFRDAHVASAFVKGRKGAELTISVTTGGGDKDENIARLWTPRLKSRDAKVTDARIVQDDPHPQTVKLTGDWQRVAAWIFADARRGQNRKYTLRIATADGSAFALKGLQYELQQKHEPDGDRVAPGAPLPGGQRVGMPPFVVDLPKLGVDFPYTNGAFSAWVKLPTPSNLEPILGPILCWDRSELGPKVFRSVRGSPDLKSPIDPADTGWQHVALVWTATNAVVYRNGVETGRVGRRIPRDAGLPSSTLRLGCSNWAGRIPSGYTIDDLALYDRPLSATDVQELAKGLRSADVRTDWMAEKPTAVLFNRNEREARLVTIVYAPEAAKATFALSVGGQEGEPFDRDLRKGANVVIATFDARAFAPGKYRFSLVGGERRILRKAEPRLKVAGELEILPQFDRNAYRVFNWGGNKPIPVDYAVAAGMNVEHLGVGSLTAMEEATRRGLHLAIEVSPLNDIFDNGFDRAATGKRLGRKLVRHAGRANWDMTLTTTEQANVRNWRRAREFPRWREWAEKEGLDPFSGTPEAAFQLGRARGWKAPADGVLPADDMALRTMLWVRNGGDPVLQFNRLAAEAAHRLSPGNLVWAEPSCPFGVDMTAYWTYDYSTRRGVSRMKRSYEEARSVGTAYMPTLGMGYGDGLEGYSEGEAPADPAQRARKRFGLTQSVDELVIKTLLCMGTTRATAMSYFDLCSWSEGEKQATPVPGKPYAEPGSGRRFGERMRSDLLPALMVLKDLDTDVGCPVAVFLPQSTDHTSGLGWAFRSYIFDVTAELFRQIPECDVLGDGVTAETLSRYRHVIYPSASSIWAPNDAALEQAAKKGTKLYVDFLCRRQYPNAVRFDDGQPKTNVWNNYAGWMKQFGPSWDRYRKLLADIRLAERGSAAAFLEKTDGDVLVYPRRSALGVNCCLVVNDTRGLGPLNRYNKSPDYRPHGAPAKATVSLKIPSDWTVYEFFSSRSLETHSEGGRVFVDLDLPAAGGALLMAYPKPLAKLTAQFERTDDPREGVLAVTLADADGAAPKGRQLVRLELADEKGPRDESGLYTLVDGVCRIPIYFPVGGEDAELKAELVERTSGLKAVAVRRTGN